MVVVVAAEGTVEDTGAVGRENCEGDGGSDNMPIA